MPVSPKGTGNCAEAKAQATKADAIEKAALMVAIMPVRGRHRRRILFLTTFFFKGFLVAGFFETGFLADDVFAFEADVEAALGGAFLVKGVVFVLPADPLEAAAFRKGAVWNPGS